MKVAHAKVSSGVDNDDVILPALPGKSYVIHGVGHVLKKDSTDTTESLSILAYVNGSAVYFGHLAAPNGEATVKAVSLMGMDIITDPGFPVMAHHTSGGTHQTSYSLVYYSVIDALV
jgi:hypothetical protein